MIQVDGGLCRLRLGPTPAPAASNGDRDAPSRSRAHLPKAEKRCRTATPWPIALCSAPLVGFLNQAVMTASEEEREQILSTPSRRDVIRSQNRKWGSAASRWLTRFNRHDGGMPHVDMSRAVGGTFRASGPMVQDVTQ
jgi:hypothetical protein